MNRTPTLFCIIPVLFVGCHQVPAPGAIHAQHDVFWMSPQERSISEKKALAGDENAAVALAAFYELYMHDNDLGIRWTRTAAILGHPSSKQNISLLLIQRGRAEDRAEAIDWLVAAAKDGDEVSKSRLREMTSGK